MAVSASEKNPETTSRMISAVTSADRGMSFNAVETGGRSREYPGVLSPCQGAAAVSAAAQDYLEHEARADVGQHERCKAGESPAYGGAPAPTVPMSTGHKRGEDQPGGNGEH